MAENLTRPTSAEIAAFQAKVEALPLDKALVAYRMALEFGKSYPPSRRSTLHTDLLTLGDKILQLQLSHAQLQDICRSTDGDTVDFGFVSQFSYATHYLVKHLLQPGATDQETTALARCVLYCMGATNLTAQQFFIAMGA